MHSFNKIAFLSIALLIGVASRGHAQSNTDNPDLSNLDWSTDSTGPRRFVSVHGHRSAIFGYDSGQAATGLEVWAYPVQILQSYSVAFRPQGGTTLIAGEAVLRRIVYSPEAITRIYAGPDFILRERLFVPLDEPGAIITYEVEGTASVDIEVRFLPVLDLMWPASIGGQETLWSSTDSAYLLSELTHRFAASVGSPDIVAHDATPNSGQQVGRAPGLAFTIRGSGHKPARVIIAGAHSGNDASTLAKRLLDEADSLETTATDHYRKLLGQALQIETPDADTNRALAWAELALEQAWVCNPDLGCATVAGYGPSRNARRPQYDWYFAGDGMVAIQALLAAGEYARAKQELEFILKYQDQKNGMVWHELSQSAAIIDWRQYPYMFVHVELTFDFLDTIDDYYSATGDKDFLTTHWDSIALAYKYCQSLLDAKDGLPRIPADKEGAREQDALSDELTMSASWAAATQSFAELAAAVGHNELVENANKAGEQAIAAIAQRYWDKDQNSSISGYTRLGAPLIDRGISPTTVRGKPLFSEAQRNSLLNQFATADFETDWGTRGRGANAKDYAPNSYASGSVWAVVTAGTASAFYSEHRPATAWPIWNALVSWNALDSLGHIHEALAGDFYHEEIESVPEQTWSSASFFASAVHGLLGLQADGANRRLTFAPHLPATWDSINLRNLHVGNSNLSIHMAQSAVQLQLDMQNEGPAVGIDFDPEIPLGAALRGAHLGKRSIPAKIEQHSQDTHAHVEFNLPHGSSSLTIDYRGGVALIRSPTKPLIGDSSKAMKITAVRLTEVSYSVEFDYIPSEANSFEVRTSWTVKSVQGGKVDTVSPGLCRVTVIPSGPDSNGRTYEHGKVAVNFTH